MLYMRIYLRERETETERQTETERERTEFVSYSIVVLKYKRYALI